MKLQHLRSLVALVDAGSIRGAARALSLTQPAVTARIAELESEVGATLVDRTPHGTTVTPAGRALLSHARLIDSQMRRAEQEMAELTSHAHGTLSVGVSPLAAIELVGPVLTAFATAHPGARVEIVEGLFLKVATSLREGTVDFVVAPIPLEKHNRKVFQVEELIAYPQYVVGRQGHPLLGARRLKELADAKWVVGARTSAKAATVEELYAEHGLRKPDIAVFADSVTQVQAAIAHSDMLGLLPRPLFDGWPSLGLRALPISDSIRPVRLGLMSRAGARLSPMAADLAGLIRQQARDAARLLASRRRDTLG